MKRIILIICGTVLLTIYTLAGAAVVYKIAFPDGLTGGSATDLDGIHSGNSNVANGTVAIVTLSGTSKVLFFKYMSEVTGTENTSTHPYLIVPDDLPTTGVWWELSAVSPFFTP